MAISRLYEAVRIAKRAHRGQKDKAGEEYILHPLTVSVLAGGDEDTRIVAVLHDVVEDTDITIKGIRSIFGDKVADAIDSLTHRDGEDYFDYISRVKENKIATAVKIADLAHNSDLGRIASPTDKDRKRIEKYKKAMKMLK